MNKFSSAEIDCRSEAIWQLGLILNKFTDLNVVSINRDPGDRDYAIITFHCPIRMDNYTKTVNIGGDSVTAAIKDIIKAVEG